MSDQLFLIKRIIFLLIITFSGVAMAVKEPKFSIQSKSENYEIRLYEPTIVAETWVDADFNDAGNLAFRVLADYIFGNNKLKIKIDMTAPVSQQTASTKIDMTAPVTQTKSAQGHFVQFTMPDNFTLETLPIPNDPRVTLKRIAERKIAVYSYSGSWSQSRFKSKLAEFYSELSTNNIKTVGEPIFARYNSPFQLWFLRRNEIWLEVVN